MGELESDDGTTYAVVAEWQTHQLEGLAVAIPWRFESSRPHHNLYDEILRLGGGFFAA